MPKNKGGKPGDARSANILGIYCTKYPKMFGPAGQLSDSNNKGESQKGGGRYGSPLIVKSKKRYARFGLGESAAIGRNKLISALPEL